ncbi:YdcF family protein [Corynebacterium halotolerans]|uniref:YdcF family protein n=1 Tax=Corynebacterium halotolerans TaxID=225326 RepID=UPI003CE849FE
MTRRANDQVRRVCGLVGALGVLVLVAIAGVSVTAWFLYPPESEARPADAVLVLAGADDGRHEYGAGLVEDGIADNLVISSWNGSDYEVGRAHCAGPERPEGARSQCMKPSPVSTVGEAQTFADLAAEEGWTSAVVVTNRPHTRRVRSVFERCTDLDIQVVNHNWVSKSRIPYHVAREIGGYLKFWATSPC